MARRVADDKVAWIPPELLGNSQGEYRLVEAHNEEDGSTDFGPRVVWVDDAPDDRDDGSGHFEVHEGDEDSYAPRRAKGESLG